MRALSLALVFVLTSSLACASTASRAADNTSAKAVSLKAPSLDQRVATARTYFEAFAHHVGFQGSVLIAKNGQALFAQDVGVTQSGSGGKSSGAPQYFIGSITKMLTAALAMREVERGNMALNAPVSRYLKDFTGPARDVTVEQLLSHTSGIPNYTDFSEFDAFKPGPASPAQILALFASKSLTSPPGTSYEYSNSNFIVLGAILERLSGRSFETLLKTEILMPARMNDTYFPTSGKMSEVAKTHPNLQRGMAFGTDVLPQPANDIDVGWPSTAGAMVSTAADLLKWNSFLFGGGFLRPETIVDMQTRRLGTTDLVLSQLTLPTARACAVTMVPSMGTSPRTSIFLKNS